MPSSQAVQTSSDSDPQLVAKTLIREWLPEIAAEILAWNRTGLLPNGKLREAATTIEMLFPHDSLAVAQKWSTDAALDVVANSR